MDPVDEKLRSMLRDLGRAVQDAISDSSEVSQTLGQIRSRGYSLYLSINCRKDSPPEGQVRLPAPTPMSSDPEFRIDGQDLSFLKSIGIDPTRKVRRRRKS